MDIFSFTVRTDTSETGLSRRYLESVPVSSELSFPFFDVSEVLPHKQFHGNEIVSFSTLTRTRPDPPKNR